MMTPIPKSTAELEHRKAVDDFLTRNAWPNIAGYEEADRAVVDVQMSKRDKEGFKPKPSTYGETTPLGARQLFHYMGMTSDGLDNEDIVFVDMGSGVGKLVMQVYLELPRISRSIGIELAPLRHQAAVKAWSELEPVAKKIRAEIPIGGGPISEADLELINGDFRESDLSEATHIYISSLCFTEDMMYQIAKKIEQDAPNVQCIATLCSLPSDFQRKGIRDRINFEVIYKTFGLIERTEFVEMSWTEYSNTGSTVYIYSRPDKLDF